MAKVKTERATAAVTAAQLKRLDRMAEKLGRTRGELVERYIEDGLEFDTRMAKIVGMPGMNQLMHLVNAVVSTGDEKVAIRRGLKRLADLHQEREEGQGRLFPVKGGSDVGSPDERPHSGSTSQRYGSRPGTRPATA